MREPAALLGAVNSAIAATLGVLTLIEVLDEELAGGLGIALAAWIGVGHAWLRGRVTPVDAPRLTVEQHAKVDVIP